MLRKIRRLYYRFKFGCRSARKFLAVFGLIIAILCCGFFSAFTVSADELTSLPEWSVLSTHGLADYCVIKSDNSEVFTEINATSSPNYYINVFNYQTDNKSMFVEFQIPFIIPDGYTLQINFGARSYATLDGNLSSNETARFNYAILQDGTELHGNVTRLANFDNTVYDDIYSRHTLTYTKNSGSYDSLAIRFGISVDYYNTYGLGARGLRIYENFQYRLLSPGQLEMYNSQQIAKQITDALDKLFKAEEDQTDTLINGWDGDGTPMDGDNVGSFKDAEANLQNSQQSGLNDVISFFSSVPSLLGQYRDALLGTSNFLGSFFGISVFNTLLFLSMTIGVVMLLLNLIPNAVSSFNRQRERRERHEMFKRRFGRGKGG